MTSETFSPEPGAPAPPPPPPVPRPPTPPAAPVRRSPWPWVALGCAVVVLAVFALASLAPFAALLGGPSFDRGGNIGVISISGQIHTGGGGLFAEAGASHPIMEQLRKAAEDDSLKAVVLDINSGGGSAAASQAIAEEVRRLNKIKPVIVSMGDAAASGAYYIASQARKIVANPATLTGSIGVIAEMLTFHGLMERYGVRGEAITTGKYKDMGSPFRDMRPDERALLQDMLQDTYNQFVKDVAEGRRMDEAKVRALADGRLWTGAQAQKIGLVDELGNFYDALDLAAKEAGIKGKPKPRYLGGPRGLADLFRMYGRVSWPAPGLLPRPTTEAYLPGYPYHGGLWPLPGSGQP